jgi:MFS family permease
VQTGPDAVIVILLRAMRMFAHGASALVLALFFSALGVSDERIGLFMTFTLAGDVILSLGLTLVADRIGRRLTLRAGAALMVFTGCVFVFCEQYWMLLGAAVVGVVSATGTDFGPFRAIEESIISELTDRDTRADVLVWYVLTSSLGSSAGTACAGRLVDYLGKREGWSVLDAYHICFGLYGAMGIANILLSLFLSERCELRDPVTQAAPINDEEGRGEIEEGEMLLNGQDSTSGAINTVGDEDDNKSNSLAGNQTSWISQISKETRSVMYAMWFLLMVDSLADGMVGMSLTTYYMDKKFHLSKSVLGEFLSISYFLSAASTVFAGPLTRRIGLVNTMVFTHIPSSAAVLFFPFPESAAATFALLLLRVGLNNMDQAPRSALIAAIVRPEERTAVMGITGMLRTLASTTGPSLTGVLAGNDKFWIAFVVAGSLRLAYDCGLFAMFINIRLYKHERPLTSESSEEP